MVNINRYNLCKQKLFRKFFGVERGPEPKKFDNHYYKLKKFKYSYVSMSEEVGAVDLKLNLQFSKVKTEFF